MQTKNTQRRPLGKPLMLMVAVVAVLGLLGVAAITVSALATQFATSGPQGDALHSTLPNEVVVSNTAGDGRDARGLRLGLLALLGLALAGGAVMQAQTVSNAPRPRPQPLRRAADDTGPNDAPLVRAAPVPAPQFSDTPAIPRCAPLRPTALRVSSAPAPTRAEAECARAITAACRYDRHTTLAAFSAALVSDPACKPAAAAGFWEMPPAGHGDLARAYLRARNRADARSVVTFALLLFPYDRALTALLQEIEGGLQRA